MFTWTLFKRIVRKLYRVTRRLAEETPARIRGTALSDAIFLRLLGIPEKNDWIARLRKDLIKRSIFSELNREIDRISDDERLDVLENADQILRHEFELLGSGRVKVDYFCKARGVSGSRYEMQPGMDAKEAQSKRIALYPPTCGDYEPIDWHLDFKSGYRWSEKTWFARIRYGQPGVDIKVPWELSRFQHGIRLGQAYQLTGDERYAKEVVCQIVDWIESNPRGFGPNWVISMDAAIRACNWIVSLSFVSESVHLTDDVLWIIAKSLFQHGDYIRKHLERTPELTSNHYTSNIAGLYFISSICPNLPNASEWAAFSKNELEREIVKQVYDDGCDFEASTCYHRLVLELFFYPALLGRIIDSPFSPSYLARLEKMFEALRLLLHENGEVPQIGDNDSGRFLIFERPQTSVLRMDHLLPVGDWFFGLDGRGYPPDIDDSALYWLANKRIDAEIGKTEWLSRPSHLFQDAGWAVLRNDEIQVVVSSGTNGQNGNGGHAHNDKLSFEVSVRGVPVIVDPGTYLYTPDLDARNQFRSTKMHSTPQLGDLEQNPIILGRMGAFFLTDHARATIESFDKESITASHNGFGETVRMNLGIRHECLSGSYTVSGGEYTMRWLLHPNVVPRIYDQGAMLDLGNFSVLLLSEGSSFNISEYDYSPEYGVLVRASMITTSFETCLEWQIELADL